MHALAERQESATNRPWLSAGAGYWGGSWGLDERTWIPPTMREGVWRPRARSLCAPSTPEMPAKVGVDRCASRVVHNRANREGWRWFGATYDAGVHGGL